MIFHIHGMHCPACERLAEMELREVPGVKSARASLVDATVEVEGDFGERPAEDVLRELGAAVKKHGYTLAREPLRHRPRWREFLVAAPMALALMTAFLLVQKLGVGRLVDATQMGYGVAFLIGVVASLSSCMAIVGGLVLAISTYYAQKGEKIRPQIIFHASRLGTFLVLGGVTGWAGSILHLGDVGRMVFGVGAGAVMAIMGVGLLDVFPWAQRFRLILPQGVGDRVQALTRRRPRLMPLAFGIATFFLPCGFTQAMQAYTLQTGSFATGALTMFSFALGTFPVLALLSFSAAGTHGRTRSGVFFKTAGLLVILFGVYDIFSSLAGYGLIPPVSIF